MIGIVDYGTGNIGSVIRAVEFLGGECRVVRASDDLYDVDRIMLPGDGSFGRAVRSMTESGLYDAVRRWVAGNRATLGIGLGMQLLFEGSEESPDAVGFSVFHGICSRFGSGRIPLAGWSAIDLKRDSELFKGVPERPYLYFSHSYYAPFPEDADALLATNRHGMEYCCALFKGSVFGVQFHPEKSGEVGLKMISNWMEV
jgi:glutamine amidotransferase